MSRWSLSVEYHYSSFRGDVDGLLRRGYDVYLQHTNYGDREIKLRLPYGMPVAKSVWSQYVDGEQLDWKKDAKGHGGILSLHPFHETGELEEVWETQKYLDAAIHRFASFWWVATCEPCTCSGYAQQMMTTTIPLR